MGITLDEWLELAVHAPGVVMLPVDRDVLVESTRLPGDFHKDPADQIIVATARHRGLRLLTNDAKIRRYPHVPVV